MKMKYSLIGIDSNAFSVMGYVSSCMKKEGCMPIEIKDYQARAMDGDYNELLCISQDEIDKLNGVEI